ncbi:hypothetical protein H6P81_002772 [Aristolochia fimbriata]|uniref:Uncharacterized protein n=1 Tax=Aristolochia fimbriata TaxID=158543 RepID=A0AAV7FB90_ARIFI|nr:hypothetical protein H6P81_002772 [Aristolochia fimbriata]
MPPPAPGGSLDASTSTVVGPDSVRRQNTTPHSVGPPTWGPHVPAASCFWPFDHPYQRILLRVGPAPVRHPPLRVALHRNSGMDALLAERDIVRMP